MVCSYAVWGAGVMRSPLECTLQHGPGWVAKLFKPLTIFRKMSLTGESS
jgi:hypothetical protein